MHNREQVAVTMQGVLKGNSAAEQVFSSLVTMPGEQMDQFNQVVGATPLIEAGSLAPRCELFVKYEGAQPGGAYKIRGATYKILAEQALGNIVEGVVVASTGNHANATAIAASALGINCAEGLCPKGTVEVKKRNMETNGLKVDDGYGSLEDALHAAKKRGEDGGMLFIHPYDDPAVMAGQATVGLQVMRQLRETGIDPNDPGNAISLVLPAGGGGLAAGTAVALSALYPRVRVVTAQMKGGDGLARALQGNTIDPTEFDYSCDGAAVPVPGKLALQILGDRRLHMRVLSVTKGEIGKSMDLLARYHDMPEPAGALAMAAALRLAHEPLKKGADHKRRILVPVSTGINTTPDKVNEFRAAAFWEMSRKYANRSVDGVAEIIMQRLATTEPGRPFRRQGTRVISSPARS